MPMQHPQHGGGAAMAVFNGPGFPSSANTTVSFGGDPILMHAKVALIFYGSAWQNPGLGPSAAHRDGRSAESVFPGHLLAIAVRGAAVDSACRRPVMNL